MPELLLKDLINIISKEQLVDYYIINNHSWKECLPFFNVSSAMFAKLLKYYNIHKPRTLSAVHIKKTKLEHYGNENYNNPEQRAKTNIDKYGVDNQFKRADMMEKVRAENNEKYGSEYMVAKNIETRIKNSGSLENSYKEQVKKTKQTCLEKYGVDWAIKSDAVKAVCEKAAKAAFNEKYGCDNYFVMKDAKRSNGSKNSHANLAFENLLIKNSIEYEKEFLLNGKWYDFKVGNTLIEINSSATHNINWNPWNKEHGKDKDYHMMKTNNAIKYGYNCLTIWDWDDQQKVIDVYLTKKDIIDASLCEVKLVDTQTAVEFINKYNYNSYNIVDSDVVLGLYYNSNLVSAMVVSKLTYGKNYLLYLSVLCDSMTVLGGNKKLFDYYINNYSPDHIFNHFDLNKFNGFIYDDLGFSVISTTIIEHWYNMKTNEHKIITGQIEGEEDSLLDAGFVQIYDCGQATYMWTKDSDK